MNIVLHEPEIPFNTGAIGRTCVATKSTLHLIKPYGFILNDKNIKKAGMDYWPLLKLREYISYEEFMAGAEEEKREMEKVSSDNTSGTKIALPKVWYATTKAHKTYTEVSFSPNDYIVFGKESAGIPEEILVDNEEQ